MTEFPPGIAGTAMRASVLFMGIALVAIALAAKTEPRHQPRPEPRAEPAAEES
jgi:hypothetical protein